MNQLKELNKIQRILYQKQSFLSRDLVNQLIDRIKMLQKQKEFLQSKLRQKHRDNKDLDLCYIGSFIDGEGYIEHSIQNKANGRGKRYDSHVVRIEITNTDFGIIDYLHNFFGFGFIYEDKPRKTATGNMAKPIKRYVAQQFQAYKVLKMVAPYMKQKEKLEKAFSIIAWYENENKQAVNRIKEFNRSQ